MTIAREADKRHSDIQAEADQKAAEIEQARQGDQLQQAKHFSTVAPELRDRGHIQTIMTDAEMRENPDKLFDKPKPEPKEENDEK